MRLAVTVLGLDLFSIEISTDEAGQDDGAELAGGTTSAYPLGYTASPGDQRWEAGVELG